MTDCRKHVYSNLKSGTRERNNLISYLIICMKN